METLLESVITTSCSCEDYDEENDMSYPSDFCVGCYEQSVFEAEAIMFEWRRRNFYQGEYALVRATNLNWDSISINKVVHLEKLVDLLKLKGEYTLYIQLDGRDLTIRRTSHDEPTGAFFDVQFIEDDEINDIL
jgi:hypothetical protein